MIELHNVFDIFGFIASVLLVLIVVRRFRRFFERETRGFFALLVGIIFLTYLIGGLNWVAAIEPFEFISDYTRILVPVLFSLFFYALIRDSAARDIRNSEGRLRLVMSQIPAITWTTDRNLRVVSANGTGLKSLGAGPEDIVGRSLFDIYGTNDPEFQSLKLHRAALEGESCQDELHFNGVSFDVYLEPLQDEAGYTSGVLGMAVDITARKKAEQEQARLAAILDATPDFVGISDWRGKALYVNRAGRRLLGLGEEEDITKMVVAEQQAPWALEKVLNEGVPSAIRDGIWRGETSLLNRNGEETPVSQIIIAHNEATAGGRYFSTIARDISESKRAERALQESAANLKAIFNNTQQAFLLLDADLKVRTVNPVANQWARVVLGREIKPGAAAEDVFGQFELTSFRDVCARALRGESVMQQSEVPGAGDRLFWFETNFNPVVTDDGEIVGISMSVLDITKRKLAEQELLREKNFSDSIIDSLPAIFYLINDRGEFLRFNDHMVEISGYSPEEVRRMKATEFFEGENQTLIVSAIQQVLTTGEATAEASIHTKSGQDIPIFFTGLRISLKNQTCILGVGLDVSDRRRAELERQGLEEQLRQSQKMESIGQLAGGMAHDFNNLLVAINGYSEILLEKLPKSDPNRDDVLQINKAGERAALLTRQLLAFSRRQMLKPRVLDFNLVVTDMQKMLDRLIGEQVTVCTTLAPDLGRIKADPGQLEQVILNLAVNARDAMPEGGSLTIATRNVVLDADSIRSHLDLDPGRYVQLSVTDTGVGMDEVTLLKIFEPFFTTKSKDKGTGLGLAMVYGIIKQSGGSITVTSEPGKGTTFRIYLPRVDEAIQEEDESPATASRVVRGTETILVAEDDDAPRRLTCDILRSHGYEVIEAVDAAEATRLYRASDKPIDLLVTDVVMPRMNGPELARQLQRERPGTPVLYMSGYTDNSLILEGVVDESIPFLQKPFTPRLLVDSVRRLLDEAVSPD